MTLQIKFVRITNKICRERNVQMKLDIAKLDNYRLKALLNQQELADKANVSRATVSTIMNRGTCSKATLFKLAKALDVEPVELLKVEG